MRPMALIGGLAVAMAALMPGRHAALFAWMVAAGLGVPPGEDLLVASLGVLVASGDFTGWVALPLAILAVVTSDTVLFTGGQAARSAVCGGTARWSHRAARGLEVAVGRRDTLAVAIARFVPGLRTLVFVSVGASGLSRGRFLLVDACAAAVWVPLVMTCGAAIIALVFGEGSSMKEWL